MSILSCKLDYHNFLGYLDRSLVFFKNFLINFSIKAVRFLKAKLFYFSSNSHFCRNDQPKYICTSRLLKNKNSLKGVTIKTLDVTEPVRGLKQLDTTKFRSERAQIGPLEPSDKKEAWHDKFDGPIMCVYKLAKIR